MIPTRNRSEWPAEVRNLYPDRDVFYLGVWERSDPQRPSEREFENIRKRHLPDFQVPAGGWRGYLRVEYCVGSKSYELFMRTRKVIPPADQERGLMTALRFHENGDIRAVCDTDDEDWELFKIEERSFGKEAAA